MIDRMCPRKHASPTPGSKRKGAAWLVGASVLVLGWSIADIAINPATTASTATDHPSPTSWIPDAGYTTTANVPHGQITEIR